MRRFFIQIATVIALSLPIFGIFYNQTHAQIPSLEQLREQDFLTSEEKNGVFYEYKSVTRGDFLRWIITNAEIDEKQYNNQKTPFIDISQQHNLSGFVAAGYVMGALSDFEKDKKFLPNKKLTRLQAVTMLMNLEGVAVLHNYGDIIIGNWKDLPHDIKDKNIILVALEKGYIKSTKDGFIYPNKKLTREEALWMLYIHNIQKNSSNNAHVNISISNANDENNGKHSNLDEVEKLIESQYWQTEEIETEQLEDAAISGLVDSLEDPYSVYMPPEVSKKFENYINEETDFEEKEYAGLGVVVQEANDGGMVITEVFPGSPAEISDIRVGDVVIEVEGENVQKLSVSEIAKKIKGPVGTSVNITVTRGEKNIEKRFIREKIFVENLSSVTTSVKNNIVWIKVRAFKSFTAHDFEKALQENVSDSTRGVIVDLRYNPGGLMSAAQEMLGEVLPDGSIAVRLYSNDGEEIFYVDGSGEYTKIPLVVFQNEYSASASEIFSASIQDYERGKIIGTTSYGKGIAQTLFSLKRGSLKLTTAEFRSPLQNAIHHIGISPDIHLKTQDDASYLYEAKKIFR